jgi:hypothetical protein
MVNSGVNHQAAARLGGCQLCKPVAPAGPNTPPMPSRPPPVYRTMTLRAAVPGGGQDRQHVQRIRASRSLPASNTGQRHNPLPPPRHCASLPRPCDPTRIPPKRVSQMITQNPLNLSELLNAFPAGRQRARPGHPATSTCKPTTAHRTPDSDADACHSRPGRTALRGKIPWTNRGQTIKGPTAISAIRPLTCTS